MGNNPSPQIPAFLLKNWQQQASPANTFKNRITGQLAHKHMVTVESEEQLEGLKVRMREHREVIVKVLYYHHAHDSIYHVYTDEILPMGRVKMSQAEAKQQKRKVIAGFEQLMEEYGCMRVCGKMLGVDSRNKLKIWIHINPTTCLPLTPCQSESEMVADVVKLLDEVIESGHSFRKQEYLTFEEVMMELPQPLLTHSKHLMHNSTKYDPQTLNKQTKHNHNLTNLNININIDLEKKNLTKLQKLNPILCETSRHQTENDHVQPQPQSNSPVKKSQVKKNKTFQGITYTSTNGFSPENKYSKIYRDYGHACHQSAYQESRRKSDNSPDKLSNPAKKSKVSKKIIHNTFMNVFSEKPEVHSPEKKIHSSGQFKLQPFKNHENRPFTNIPNKNIPFFLRNKNIPSNYKERAKTQIPSPSTQRPKHQVNNNQKNLFNFYVEKYDPLLEQNQKKQDGNYSILKSELNNLLGNDEEEQIVNPDFQKFKEKPAIFIDKKKQNLDGLLDQNEIIKEKVQKKKATFANLKMEALKILEDDF